MDVKNYISSGILELYLTGTLSEEENFEVYQNAMKHPQIKEEIWSIESAVLELSRSVLAEISPKKGFDDLKDRIGENEVLQPSKKRINWSIFGSRAAAVLFAIVLLWLSTVVSSLKSDINAIDRQNQVLEHQIVVTRDSLVSSYELVQLIKGNTMLVIPLEGQQVSPTSSAKVYWDKAEKKVYIDAQGLPDPAQGFVYQVWSLTSDPLTSKSVGLLSDFLEAKHKIFSLNNPNTGESQTFGITLEPDNGSETPTMEQLYTLGGISSSS